MTLHTSQVNSPGIEIAIEIAIEIDPDPDFDLDLDLDSPPMAAFRYRWTAAVQKPNPFDVDGTLAGLAYPLTDRFRIFKVGAIASGRGRYRFFSTESDP